MRKERLNNSINKKQNNLLILRYVWNTQQLLKMSAINLATFYNPTLWQYHEVTLAVGTITAASLFLFLFRTYVSVSTNGKEKKKNITKKSLPKCSMGILETIQMMAGRKVPMQLFNIAKDLDSWNFELNLPVPGHPRSRYRWGRRCQNYFQR